MILTISGQTPAQKNRKIISYRAGTPFLRTADSVKAWQEAASWELKKYAAAYPGKVKVYYTFFVKDNRRRDLDNMIATVNDALVKAGIIEDDCWQILRISGSHATIDKENPRAEIEVNGTNGL